MGSFDISNTTLVISAVFNMLTLEAVFAEEDKEKRNLAQGFTETWMAIIE